MGTGVKRFAVAVAAGVALIATACSSSSETSTADGGGATGSLNISGSSTVQPITSLVAEKFRAANPGVTNIAVNGPGTSDGFELFCNGETDVQDASRPISEEEVAACEEAGIDWVELEVAQDALSVIGNPSNAIECMTFGDLYALFGPESNDITNWADANGLATEVGGTGNFPDAALTIVAPGEESGTYGSFIELAIGDIAEERGEPDDQLRSTYQISADDNVIVDNAAGTEGGLGFVGFAFAENAGDSVKKFQIDGGDGCVGPSSETVQDGSYPLSRSLYIYVNTEKVASNPALVPFIDFYLSDEGLASVEEVQYVSLPPDRIEETRGAWESASA